MLSVTKWPFFNINGRMSHDQILREHEKIEIVQDFNN